MDGLAGPPKISANFAPLSPVWSLQRSAEVFPNRLAVIHGDIKRTYAQFFERCRMLSSALNKRGIGKGCVVALLLNNTPENLEAHFAVPMSGAVMCPLNYRLDSRSLEFMLGHSEAKVLIVDREYSKLVAPILSAMPKGTGPLVIDVDDELCKDRGPFVGSLTYEKFLLEGNASDPFYSCTDEWDTLSLCYTSGTTADPKGVLLHHRGAYLKAVHLIIKWPLPKNAVFLWAVPMFHLNGWFFPYAVTMMAGTHVCLRKVVAAEIFKNISTNGVTHLCGAPIVMSTMLQYTGKRDWSHEVFFMASASAPPAPVLARMKDLGINVCHVYGMTEGYGTGVMCEWKEEWNAKPIEERADLLARQGVKCLELEWMDVYDQETRKPVPRDGETIGEVVMAGNTIMKGYYKNPTATAKEFRDGVFNTGDLGVMHPDGYIQLKDRSKDIIISGGENISSLEVESLMLKNPKIVEVAVVARPDEKWGETPVAWVVIKDGETLDDDEIYKWCKTMMPGYMVPRTYIFESLDDVKTSTGKVQKHHLRARAKTLTKDPFGIKSADDAAKQRSKL
mmetsp:Transcript_63034/g.133050  ORF Transcript_63034/g.133050 Transcript_63034/m.133050 type:complete len:562 (+) Transcript_63034:164-1849(+)|eukprot:CAMPEP_0206443300 /NCGR_PEP_ID=MMETSP0324_2-20121206/14289_1 /ASSEMBLY_ACC=CAM_ASM_000836 /TAXON_ID=2866 /ORGANISM="Crypthecodinium cohnii, Strain Seligo" /LENGTH=561 /DNA_ID=CAMNT_0053911215 /DNA_START=236 /DNA_END=1921 /DNA_ORIENTATION=+